MPNSERTTKINVEEAHKFGSFANAFRVVEEVGPDCFLDFMVYSAAEQEATVVARVRVRRDFLPAIKEKLGDALVSFGDDVGDASDEEMDAMVAYRKTKEPVH
jgi:hypothetical protein